CVQYAQFPYTF
nr:immunoglobulin light chain junction region [Mus musculus]NSL98238.1 immunoglobulin light chain junction region [Mus musculus]NSM00857.1 immunoglobulin light chain junction region [Mus musculus]